MATITMCDTIRNNIKQLIITTTKNSIKKNNIIFILFFFFTKSKKKVKGRPLKIGTVGLPEAKLFFLGLIIAFNSFSRLIKKINHSGKKYYKHQQFYPFLPTHFLLTMIPEAEIVLMFLLNGNI